MYDDPGQAARENPLPSGVPRIRLCRVVRDVEMPAAAQPAFKDRAPRPTNEPESRTTLRSPLNSAPDISASNRPAEGALGPYLRAIRAHRMLVIVVTLAAIGASIAWIALRPPTYEATANILVTPLAQEDQTFLGLQVLREARRPDTYGPDRCKADPVGPGGERTAEKMGDDWTPRRSWTRSGHAGGREQHPRGHGKADYAQGRPRSWPTRSSIGARGPPRVSPRRPPLSSSASTS